MKTIILLSTFFFFNVLLHGQTNPNWITKFEVPYTQMMAIDHLSGNELVALKTKRYSKLHQVITINKETGDTTEIMKLDGGAGFKVTALKADFLGNVLIAGTYKKELRIGAYEKKSETHVTKTFLAKFKPGQALDTTKIQHFEALETSQLGVLPNNEIVLSGYFRYGANILGQQLEAGLDDVFVMKLTPGLQLGWIKNYGEGSDERTTSMHVSKDGNIIVAAKFSHKFNLGEGNSIELLRGNNYGTAIWKMSPSGSIIWHQVFSGYKYGRPETVKITSDDSFLYLGVTFEGDLLMNRDTLSSMGRQDLSIVRLDQNGKNRQLLMHVKSPYDAEIAGLLSADEDLFLAGNFEKRIHLKDQLIYAKGDTSRYSSAKEIFYVRFNKQSNQFQLETIGSPAFESCQTIAIDARNFYLAGTYDESFEWGTFSVENQDRKPDAYVTALPRVNGLSSTTDTADENDQGTADEAEGNDDTGEEDPKEPGCPDPSRPSILSIGKYTTSLNVRWRAVDRAHHYELIVAEDRSLTNPVFSSMNIPPSDNPSRLVNHLKPNHQYYVQVFVENDCGKRAKSIVVPAKTKPLEENDEPTPEDDCEAPKAPSVRAFDITNKSATVSWSPVEGATHYEFVVSENEQFTSVVYKNTSISASTTEQSITGLFPGRRYHYYVIVENDCPERTKSSIGVIPTRMGGEPIREADCNPTPPVVTNIELENYAFTASWAGLPEISHYNLYVSNFQDFRDTIYMSEDLKFTTAQPYHRVNKLKGKTNYFFNVVVTKNCKETTAIARSLNKKITTTCVDDTIIMQDPNQNGTLLFQLVDCEGNLIKMGSIIQDTMALIDSSTEDPAGILKTFKDSTVATTFKVGPIDLNPSNECDENQRRVPIQQINEEIKYECVEITDPRPESPCMDLATDRERFICLAQQGIDEAKAKYQEIKKIKDEMAELGKVYENESTSESERAKIYKRYVEEFTPKIEEEKANYDTIRMKYEQMLNAIVMKGNITLEIKNEGSGITMSPEAVGFYVHWSGADPDWKIPGPRLTLEINVSNFPKEKVYVFHQWWVNAIKDIYGQTFEKDGTPISAEGLYGFSPCIEVQGTKSIGFKIIGEFDKMGYMKFWGNKRKNYDPELWAKCSPVSFMNEHYKKHQHQIMSLPFQEEGSTGIDLDQIGFFPNHLFLANTSKIKGETYTSAFNAYYQAMEKMSDIYLSYYQEPHITFLLWQNLRLKVQNNHNKFWYQGGYRIYYGFDDLDPELTTKVKSVFN